MAELLLLLPEYMAGVLDQTKRDAGCSGSKLQWSDNRLLMSNLADGGGKGALGASGVRTSQVIGASGSLATGRNRVRWM